MAAAHPPGGAEGEFAPRHRESAGNIALSEQGGAICDSARELTEGGGRQQTTRVCVCACVCVCVRVCVWGRIMQRAVSIAVGDAFPCKTQIRSDRFSGLMRMSRRMGEISMPHPASAAMGQDVHISTISTILFLNPDNR